MLEFLFQGLLEIFGKCAGAVVELIMDCFDMTPERFQEFIPALESIPKVLESIGWSLLFLLFIIAIVRSIMSPNSQTSEHPINLLGRAVIAGGFLSIYFALFNEFFKWGTVMYKQIGTIVTDSPGQWAELFEKELVSPFTLAGIETTIAAGSHAALVAKLGGGALAVLGLIMLFLISYQLVKFLLECLERFVTLHMSVYFAPLVAPTFVTKSTSNIFSSYISFSLGQMMLWWMSILFMKIFFSGMQSFGNTSEGFILKFFILYAVLVLAQKVDTILAKLGFGIITGGASASASFLTTMAMAIHTASSAWKYGSKQFSAAKGDSGSGKSTAQPAYDSSKEATNGVVDPIRPLENTSFHADTGMNGALEKSETLIHNSEEKANRAEELRREADRLETEASSHSDRDREIDTGNMTPIDVENTSNTGEGTIIGTENAPNISENTMIGGSDNNENNTIGSPEMYESNVDSSQSSTINSMRAESAAYDSLSKADSLHSSALVCSDGNDMRGYSTAMNEAREHVSNAAYSYAEAIREGYITSIPSSSGLSINADNTYATYTSGPGQESIRVPMDSYAFMPKAECQQVAEASTRMIEAIKENGYDRGSDGIAKGYQSMIRAYENNAASVSASMQGDHQMAREFSSRAKSEVRSAVNNFYQAGPSGYHAAQRVGIQMETVNGGNKYNYTVNGPIKTAGTAKVYQQQPSRKFTKQPKKPK